MDMMQDVIRIIVALVICVFDTCFIRAELVQSNSFCMINRLAVWKSVQIQLRDDECIILPGCSTYDENSDIGYIF